MKNISYWQQTEKLPQYQKLTKDCTYDIVIVGGGISGITLAYRLNNDKLKTALVESDTLASKTTGHTTGKVSYLHGTKYADIAKAYGENTAKQYLNSNYEALEEIKKIIKINEIDCDFQENTAYLSANDKTNCEKIIKQISLFKKWGFNIIENNLKDELISMGLEHQAIFHPLKYLKALLKKCHNIDIYEHSLVTKHEIKDNAVYLTVNSCKIKCKKVVWMTRYPPNLQKGYFFRMLQEKEHIIYEQESCNEASLLDLTTSFSRRYLDDKHILMIKKAFDHSNKFYWYGQDSVPLRIIPYIGKINEFEYVSYGYDKWGMTLSHVASKMIYDLIINNDCKYKELYDPYYGKYLYSMPDIVKLVKNNYHGMIKNRIITDKNLSLKANQGKVIRYRGKLIAVYKDKQHRVFYFSPYCPHLKCVVEFNELDQTWNCPCHGSIFDCYGRLISGPATRKLTQLKRG